MKQITKLIGIKNGSYKHGMFGTKTYYSWFSMKQRCLNPNNASYKYYGGRGITICPEWMDFQKFYADMGDCPNLKSLDRFPDNNGNYEPNNCRWATTTEQNNNKRNNRFLIYEGKKQTVKQWSEELGINISTINTRIYRGWSIEKVLTNLI